MQIKTYIDRLTMSRAAARQAADVLRSTLAANGRVRIVAATGASQFDFLEALTGADGIDWSRVEMFHLDEYVGLPIDHPASFRKYLRERLIDKSGIRNYHLLDAERDPREEAERVGRELAKAPIDVAFVGIGENAHLAFNDPPADFESDAPYLVVTLDEACRRQQVGEGWFPSLEAVPAQALSMSIQQILKSNAIICIVPDARKAAAVKASLEGEITPNAPASILRTAWQRDRVSRPRLGGVAGRGYARPGPRARRRMTVELPGFFDLQVNGFAGVDFNDPATNGEAIAGALDRMRATGVTRCLPTFITSSLEEFTACVRAVTASQHPSVAGIHMEGPYLSPEDGARGAHRRAHVAPARIDDFERRQGICGGGIRLVTLAPEVPGAIALIEHLVASGRAGCHRPYGGHARADRRRSESGSHARHAPRQRLCADAATASERHLGAAGRRRGPCQLDRRRSPPAAIDGQGDGAGEGPGANDPRHRRHCGGRLRAGDLHHRRGDLRAG